MNHSLFRNILSGFSFTVINMLVSFLVVPLYLHFIDSEQLGIWFLINATISSFGIIGLIGGNQYMIKKLSYPKYLNHIAYSNYYFNTAFFMLLISSILFMIIGLTIIYNLNSFFNVELFKKVSRDEFINLILFIIITQSFIYPLSVYSGILRASKRLVLYNLRINLKLFLFSILSVLFLYIHPSIESFGLSFFISNIVIDIYNYYYIRKNFSHLVIKLSYFRKNIVKRSFSYTKNIFILLLSNTGKNMYLPYLIVNFLGPAYVTIFTVTNKLSVSISGLMSKVYMNLFPYLADFSESKSDEQFVKYYLNTLFITLRISLLFTILFIFFNKIFVTAWVGVECFAGFGINLLLALSFLFLMLKTATGIFINASGNFLKLPWINLLELTIAIILSTVLYRLYGFIGLIFGYSLSNIIYIIYAHYIIQKKYGIKFFNYKKQFLSYLLIPSMITLVVSLFNNDHSILASILILNISILLNFICEIYQLYKYGFSRKNVKKIILKVY